MKFDILAWLEIDFVIVIVKLLLHLHFMSFVYSKSSQLHQMNKKIDKNIFKILIDFKNNCAF